MRFSGAFLLFQMNLGIFLGRRGCGVQGGKSESPPAVNSPCHPGLLPPHSGPRPHWQPEGSGFLRAQECQHLKFPSKFLGKNPTLEKKLWQQQAPDSPAKGLSSCVMWERPRPPTRTITAKMTKSVGRWSTDGSSTRWSL